MFWEVPCIGQSFALFRDTAVWRFGDIGLSWLTILLPIFENNGDVQSCSNYRGIKLMSHKMKLWLGVIEHRLMEWENRLWTLLENLQRKRFICFGGKWQGSSTYRRLMIKSTRRILWWVLEKRVPTNYVDIVKDMYKGAVTSVRIGLH